MSTCTIEVMIKCTVLIATLAVQSGNEMTKFKKASFIFQFLLKLPFYPAVDKIGFYAKI